MQSILFNPRAMSQGKWPEIIFSTRSAEQLKPWEVKWPAQGHMANKGSKWDACFGSGLPTWEELRQMLFFKKNWQQA